MKLPKLIALSGHKRSGKDTLAGHLITKYEYKPISFAFELKNMVAKQYNVPRNWMDDQDKKEMPIITLPAIPSDPFGEALHTLLQDELKSGFWTPRALCILEGSVKRAVYSNYWVRNVINTVSSDTTSNYVITDMRYGTEADTIRLMLPSASLIRINRTANIITTQDPSERNLDNYKFDHFVTNDSTIEDMYSRMDMILEGAK